MSKKMRNKIYVDVLMTVALLLLMTYGLIGEAFHEWTGTALLVLLILHHVLNRRWTSGIKKGSYTPYRILQTVLVVLALLSMVGSMVSGILLSNYVFSFLEIRGVASLARTVHMVCAYWSFVLTSLHLGLHWNIVTGRLKNSLKELPTLEKCIDQVVATAIAVYGIYAFTKRQIGSYMLMRVHFAFFDYEEPLLFFLADYLAIMGLCIFIGYYCGVGLKYYKKRKQK